jgi:hypothetical protein
VENDTPNEFFANDIWAFSNGESTTTGWYYMDGYNTRTTARSNPPIAPSPYTTNNPAGRYIPILIFLFLLIFIIFFLDQILQQLHKKILFGFTEELVSLRTPFLPFRVRLFSFFAFLYFYF